MALCIFKVLRVYLSYWFSISCHRIHSGGLVGMEPVCLNSLSWTYSHRIQSGGVVGIEPVCLNSLFKAALSSSLVGRAGKIPWNPGFSALSICKTKFQTHSKTNQSDFQHLFLSRQLYTVPESFAVPVVLKFPLAFSPVESWNRKALETN